MIQDTTKVKRKTGRPKLEQPTTTLITTCVTPAQKEVIYDTAKSLGVSYSTFTRDAILAYIDILASKTMAAR